MRTKRRLLLCFSLFTALVIAPAAWSEERGGALTVTPTALNFNANQNGTAPASQTLSVTSSSRVRFTASVSYSSQNGTWLAVAPTGTLTTNQQLTVSVNPAGLGAGTYSASIVVSSRNQVAVPVNLTVTAAPSLTISPTALSFSAVVNGSDPSPQSLSITASSRLAFTASASGQSNGRTWLQISPSGSLATNQTITVSAHQSGLSAATYSGSVTITPAGGGARTVPVTFVVSTSGSTPPPSSANYKLVGWNDLGMHCFDGKDYSIFAVLPPYNTIHAHLMDSAGNLIQSATGYTVTYQAVNDPLTNTLNTSSQLKTNFWQFAAALGFGALSPDVGLKGYAMPGPGNAPQTMNFSSTDNTWLAEGIPLMPYPDSGTAPNYFPMMRLVAKNSSGTVVATTDIVLPTSDEMSCAVCHSSKSVSSAAQPAGGWVNNSDPAKDTKLNILRKHDERFQSSALFKSAAPLFGYSTSGLEATVAIKPVLCDNCHATNALGIAGVSGIPPLTTSMHSLHSTVVNPNTGQQMQNETSRDSCYLCHPGPNTQCLRGAMGVLKTSTGANQIECQSCHGSIATVATAGRQGWLEEPACQSCHTGTATHNNGQIVYNSVFSSGYTVRAAVDQTFATNANTPAAGLSLYRFSSGHGGLQCEACHNSTHAEYATPISNDNVQSLNLQGHVGMIAECSACHNTVPTTTNGGPHGLHPIGTAWVSQHQNVAESGATACQACHGADYRGTILSKTQADRTMANKSFPRGTIIGCYSCHNGPNPG
jgi:Outer membrane cytochrome MtrC/MtrF-like, domains II/IV/Viral BACON domain